MGEWKKVKLGEVIECFDSMRKPLSSIQRAAFQGQYRYYGAQEVIDYVAGYIFDGTYVLIAEDGENLISRKKPIAQMVSGRFWLNNHAHIFKANEKSDLRYLCYFLNSSDITYYVTGSAQPKLSRQNLDSIELDLPDLPTQRRIAAVLGALDDKIEVNRKICENLEAQAQALFKAWFEDFEPFQGVVPEGWKSCVLGDVSQNIRQRVGTESRKVLSAVTTGRLVLSEEYFTKQVFSQDISKYIVVDEGDFAYNPARINIGSIGVNDLGLKGCVSPVYVTVRVDREYLNYFKLFFKTENFNREVNARAIGSVRQTLGYPDFAKIPCVYPDVAFVRRFNEIYESIDLKQRTLMRESRALAAMRDALLPKLMSGELAVEKVEV